FDYQQDGLDSATPEQLDPVRRPLTEHPAIQHWAHPLEGLQATGGDVLAEATGTNLRDAEPGMSHIRAALAQGMHVITAHKAPAALAAQELLPLAPQYGVQLRTAGAVRAETPVLSTVR